VQVNNPAQYEAGVGSGLLVGFILLAVALGGAAAVANLFSR